MDLGEPILTRPAADESVAALVGRVTSDAREVASAEIALAKARVGDTVARYRAAATWFAVAGVLALAALPALLVGLILTLATLVGPGWATLIVILAVFTLAGIVAMVGKAKLARKPA